MTERVCRAHSHLLGAFADGELEPEKQMEMESHVEECEGCRERVLLDDAMRHSIKRMTRTEAPEALRARVAAAMNAEKARSDLRDDSHKKTHAWRTIVPLASAAAFALAWGAMSRGPLARTTASDSVHAGFGDDLLSELVSEHSRPLPPSCKGASQVGQFEQYVGVPVRPSALSRRSAHLVGGCVLPVNNERAAMLQYEVTRGGETRRVSVFVFDPRRIQVNDRGLTARPVGTAEVRVGRSNGYSVAVTQHAGIGYALASDMDESSTAELAMDTGN